MVTDSSGKCWGGLWGCLTDVLAWGREMDRHSNASDIKVRHVLLTDYLLLLMFYYDECQNINKWSCSVYLFVAFFFLSCSTFSFFLSLSFLILSEPFLPLVNLLLWFSSSSFSELHFDSSYCSSTSLVYPPVLLCPVWTGARLMLFHKMWYHQLMGNL